MADLLGETVGAAFIGLVGSAILYGMTNLQTYIYYNRFPRDWVFHKVFVGVLWALDTFHLALTVHLVYHYLVKNFGNSAALINIVWSLKVQIATNIVIIVIVQSLYALRVWKISGSRSRILPIFVVLAVSAGLAIGIALAVKTCNAKTFAELHHWSWAIYSSFATATLIDFVIAGSMFYYLKKSNTGFSSTKSLVSVLIRYTLSSGLITSACSTAALVTYAAMPSNLIFLSIEFLLTKLYVNSFLAMLNARHNIRERTVDESLSISLPNIKPRSANPSPSTLSPGFGNNLRLDSTVSLEKQDSGSASLHGSPYSQEYKAPSEWETPARAV